MLFDLIVKNGNIVTSNRIFKSDICVKSGKIAGIIEDSTGISATNTIDVPNHYIFPGLIDSHAHLNEPGFTWREDYEHGTFAAAVGGVTTVIDMPLQNDPALTTKEIFQMKHSIVRNKAYVDYSFWGGIVDDNFEKLTELQHAGCVAFKSFIGPVSSDFTSLSIGQAREALRALKSSNCRIGFHCEDYSIIKYEELKLLDKAYINWQDYLYTRPVVAEIIATKNIIDLARDIGSKVYICHVSHPAVAEEIKKAQREGVDVVAETCTHYLTFSKDELINNGSLFKCAPPLRDKSEIDNLWNYVLDGTLSCISSDHSPCTVDEKSEARHGVMGVWGGISGIQSMLQVIFNEGVIKKGYPPTFIAKTLCEGPASTFGLSRKGRIDIGFDADLVIVDPDIEWEITEKTLKYVNKISAYTGLKGKGYPMYTILRGEVIAFNGEIVGKQGYGVLVIR